MAMLNNQRVSIVHWGYKPTFTSLHLEAFTAGDLQWPWNELDVY